LTDLQIDRLTDWQVDRLTDWQIEILTDMYLCFKKKITKKTNIWMFHWQIDRLTDWQIDRLTDWQIDRFTDCEIDRLTDEILTDMYLCFTKKNYQKNEHLNGSFGTTQLLIYQQNTKLNICFISIITRIVNTSNCNQ
jgi:hypothetical protein